MLPLTSVGRCFCGRAEHVCVLVLPLFPLTICDGEMEASKCLSCFRHCNLILRNLWGRNLITSSHFQLRHLCTLVPCVCFSLDLNSLDLSIAQPASSLPLPSVATGTTCTVWEGGTVFTSDLKLRGTEKRQKLEKPVMSSHLSHPEKTITAKNEESNFQQASVWVGRLLWSQAVSWKQGRRCYWGEHSVCRF